MAAPRRDISGKQQRLALFARRYAVALAGLPYALTLGLRKSGNRWLVAQLSHHFGFRGHLAGDLPRVSYDSITDPSQPVVLPAVLSRSGNVSEAELIAIGRIVAARKPTSLLEIGTFDGRTTIAMAANASRGARVVTLDLPSDADANLPIESRDLSFIHKPASGELIAGSAYVNNVAQVYGDSATYDFGSLTVDIAFIDGAHSYEYVRNDSLRVRKLMRGAGSVILWHDYGTEWEGVTQALDELRLLPEFAGLVAIEGTTLAMLEIA